MTTIYSIAEYIASLIECYTLICVYNVFFNRRYIKKGAHGVLAILCSFLVAGITMLLNSTSLFSMYTTYIWVGIMFCCGLLLYHGQVISVLCISVLYMVFCGAFEFFCLAAGELVFGAKGFVLSLISSVGLYRTIYILSVKLFVFLLYYFVFRRDNAKYVFNNKIGVLLTLYGIIFFAGMQSMVNAIITENIIDMRRSALLSQVFVVLFLVVVWLLLRISNRFKSEQLEKQIIATRVQVLESDNMHINNAYREIAKISHDYNNQMRTAAILLQNKKYDELDLYINELIGDIQNVKIKPYTAIDGIDAVINSKVIQAQSAGIAITVSASYPANATIRQTDVCTILVNLLDNAIEACEKIEATQERKIKLAISSIGEMVIIKVENSYVSGCAMQTEEGNFLTQKGDGRLHG